MNRNETEKFGLAPGQLDALFASNNEQAVADREARQKAAAWPHEVDQLLAMLAKRSQSQADALRAIHDRLGVIEAAMGISED